MINKELGERRAKGLCFWCDDKFVPGHRNETKRIYSMCIIDDEDDALDEDNKGDAFNAEFTTLYLSLIALEDNTGFQALKVNRKVDKHTLFFMVNSGSTYSFLTHT